MNALQLADQICNYNRHFAEYAGYFATTDWLAQVDKSKETTYYDSVTVLARASQPDLSKHPHDEARCVWTAQAPPLCRRKQP